jgi:hypothetical protein
MRPALILAAAVAACASTAHAQTILYDTFNEADQANLFDTGNVATAWARNGMGDGTRAYLAVPFVPPVDGRITEVDLPLYTITDPGNDGLWIEVKGSSLTLPGRLKHEYYLQGAPAAGEPCCTFVSEVATGIPVHAGHQYWVEVKPLGHAQIGWALNTLGLAGAYAVKDKDWTRTDGTTLLPAMRVIGQ